MTKKPDRPETRTASPPRETWIDKPAAERIAILGHRAYVGGGSPAMWFGIARRQFHFLVAQGLRPGHRFLDIACGSLRLGQFLIPFLERGHYYGLEAEPALVEAGLREELLYDLGRTKQPVFGYGYDFDFSFVDRFDYAIAQSLFTHLTAADIALCLGNLRRSADPASVLFFTFHEGIAPPPGDRSHANKAWRYDFGEIEKIAGETGWDTQYIGDWGHERGQKMVRATPR